MAKACLVSHIQACTGKAYTLAAMMFPYCAFFPCSRLVFACSTAATGTCISAGRPHRDQARIVSPMRSGWLLGAAAIEGDLQGILIAKQHPGQAELIF